MTPTSVIRAMAGGRRPVEWGAGATLGRQRLHIVLIVVRRRWRLVVELRRFGAYQKRVVELRPPETAIATWSK